jgi:hypothetical protein
MNMNRFAVIQVPSDAARVSEVMGTKRKFWFQDNELGSCLFKFSRQNTGEDWAEKIAAELCLAIGLPCARQEFGIWQDQRGTISPEFLMPNEELVHGNDILNGLAPNYPREKKYNVSEHTLATVLPVFGDLDIQMPLRWTSPPSIKSALAAQAHPLAARAWLIQLSNISSDWITNLLAKIPDNLMSSMAKDFASQLLILNQKKLLDIQRELP